MRLPSRLAEQDGNAIITAVLVTFLVLTLGMSALATVDVQQFESRKQRERESTFQLSESVLSGQVFQLSRRWPGLAAGAYPDACTETSATASDCPAPSTVRAGQSGADFSSVAWTTVVRDNGAGAANYYDDAVVQAQPRWDANRDDMLWLRAEGRLVDPVNPTRFKRRVLVALVKADAKQLSLPRAAIVADHIATGNRGNKTLIDTNGAANEWLPGDVLLRCTTKPLPADCALVDTTKQRKHIDPSTVIYSPPTPPTTFSTEALAELRARAVAEGNYYATGCPTSLAGDVAGEAVFIEDAGAGCTVQGQATWNSAARPGVVIVGRGPLKIQGNTTFHGLIYHANLAAASGFLVELGGNATVNGSIQVAGSGGVLVGGSAKLNYDPNFLAEVRVYGTASMVQDSFREIPVAG